MIISASDIQSTLSETLTGMDFDRLFVVVDTNTAAWAAKVLPACGEKAAPLIMVPAGDDHKGLASLGTIWDALVDGGATRHSLLVAIGGGMVTDLGGFAAATFKRGIRWMAVPTTLLAMVDAATGGKTAINYRGLKNEIGAFHAPEHVILWPGFLSTLDNENLLSGMAEMFKHCLIGGGGVAEMTTIDDLFSRCSGETLTQQTEETAEVLRLIRCSVTIKEDIVAQDPTEHGIRKRLNFGHTMGHAIESLLMSKGRGMLHGYAVAWGMVSELYLSHVVCGLPVDILRSAVRMFKELYGPCPIDCHDYDALYALALHDKKNTAGDIRFVLLADVGDVRLDCIVSRSLFDEALDFLRDG